MNSTQWNTHSTPGMGKQFGGGKWNKNDNEMPITSFEDLQKVTNAYLRAAISDERSKRWIKVVKNYRRLLKMLHKENLPPGYEPPDWYRMLMYECHYHLGLALQNVGEHRRAVAQYSKALEAVFIPKNGCAAGCQSNSCLMTPLYTRRAFALVKTGDVKSALKDAEKAVVLDTYNPDVYCVRALVRNSRLEGKEALSDVQTALKYNPKHLCSLILRGTLAQPLASDDIFDTGKVRNEDHIKACSINPDCHNYLGVTDFQHPDILTFYERFLYSLNVPHTVAEINLVTKDDGRGEPAKPRQIISRDTSQTRVRQSTEPPATPAPATPNPMRFVQENLYFQSGGKRAFKCGMQKEENCDSKQIMMRRKQYGQAIREHMARPKTADDYLAYLKKERLRKKLEEHKTQRAQTAMELSVRISTPKPYRCKPPSTGDPELDRIAASLRTHMTMDGRRTRTTQTIITTQPVVATKKVKAFMDVNVEDAPRMYYRPWHGDKLPVTELPKRHPITPPFKV